jgi:D-galactosamine 6-phosphate deaminase/isomerase
MSSKYLGISTTQLQSLGASYTAKEIQNQPKQWIDTYQLLFEQKEELIKYLIPIHTKEKINVILTGAGTSAFIGTVLEAIYQRYTGINTKAIPTTDLVTHPELHLYKDRVTLLISFARSGDSPESIKAVTLANEICGENVFHLLITCNADGGLAAMGGNSDKYYSIVLPPETNDKSLAMTSSFTSMLLVGLLVARIKEIVTLKEQVERLCEYGNFFFEKHLTRLEQVSKMDFNRAVFLGSGIFQGIAQESHLKLLELTDGTVICTYNTFLGFRHGPRAVVDDNTLIVYIFSNSKYVQNYETDLVKSMSLGRKGIYRIGVMESEIIDIELDAQLTFSQDGLSIDEEFLTVVSILPAQVLGFYKSINLGFQPDTPSKSGVISRIVQGVNLYPYTGLSMEINNKK